MSDPTEAALVASEWTPPEALRRGQPVVVDPRYGHITCGELVFCDMGPILHAWSWCGDEIEPERARTLGEALIAWADRKSGEHCA